MKSQDSLRGLSIQSLRVTPIFRGRKEGKGPAKKRPSEAWGGGKPEAQGLLQRRYSIEFIEMH